MESRKIALPDRDFNRAIRVIETVQNNDWDFRKIAWLFGDDPPQMEQVFRRHDKWSDEDLRMWEKAIKNYFKYQNSIKDSSEKSTITGKPANNATRAPYQKRRKKRKKVRKKKKKSGVHYSLRRATG